MKHHSLTEAWRKGKGRAHRRSRIPRFSGVSNGARPRHASLGGDRRVPRRRPGAPRRPRESTVWRECELGCGRPVPAGAFSAQPRGEPWTIRSCGSRMPPVRCAMSSICAWEEPVGGSRLGLVDPGIRSKPAHKAKPATHSGRRLQFGAACRDVDGTASSYLISTFPRADGIAELRLGPRRGST
jgi:hypothetical protein